MQIFVNTKYDFVKWRFSAVAFSLIVVIIGAGHNGLSLGLTGGSVGPCTGLRSGNRPDRAQP